MEVTPTPLEGALLLRPKVHGDARGHFFEPYNERRFRSATGIDVHFVQDNESGSHTGVVRGLHFQAHPHGQAKLVRVVRGAVLDVIVDIRPESPTFGRHFSVVLDDRDRLMLYVPVGFAHGFATLLDGTIFAYKCSAYYEPSSERTILWNDPALGIDWRVTDPVLSDKDRQGRPLAEMTGIG